MTADLVHPLPPGLDRRVPVRVLGATGTVGQRFVSLLADHPWFELTSVAASERSAGRPYREAVAWHLPTPLPQAAGDLVVEAVDAPAREALVLSALDAATAARVERPLADAGALVVTNASAHRMDADVPLVVPEVNPGHLDLLARRASAGGSPAGAVVANPNCSTIGLTLALAPLVRAFGVRRLHAVTLQALSGAGLPGVPSLQLVDNLVPFIPTEEEKIAEEAPKILGRLEDGGVVPAELVVSAQCTRVPVIDGHTACVSVELGRDATADELREAWRAFRAEPQERGLPSAPARPVHVLDAPDAPQPRLHRDLERGMAASVGRLAPCPVLGWRFVTLSHNTLRGAAGGALLLAELCVARGLLPRRP